jgi:hypothetical protein
MLSKSGTSRPVVIKSADRKFSLISVAVAIGVLVAAYATIVSSAPAPHDYTHTSALP